MKPSIHATALYADYGSLPVLQDISFSIPKGEFFIVIGPNGSGKTTLLKILSAITPFKRGDLQIEGTPMAKYSRRSLARIMALVPQNCSRRSSLYGQGTDPHGANTPHGPLGTGKGAGHSTDRGSHVFYGRGIVWLNEK